MQISTVASIGLALVGIGGAAYGKQFLVPSALLCVSYFIWLVRYREAIWDRIFWLPEYRERNKWKILFYVSLLVMAGIFFVVRELTGKRGISADDDYHFFLVGMVFAFAGLLGTIFLIGRQFVETD